MKAFLISFFGIVLGFFAIIAIIYFYIVHLFHKAGFSGLNLFKLKEELQSEEKDRYKEIGGMTSICLPQILKDFKDFSLDEIFLLTEKSLRTIFKAIENKDMALINTKDFNLINKKLKLQLEDLIDSDIIYKYDDIVFHKHVIKRYTKENGVYKLIISSSLEYYYDKIKEGKSLIKDRHKRQTSYDTTFVYIVDESAYRKDINVYGLNCPNCGAVIESLEKKKCSYCHSGFNIEVIDLLKCWKLIDYKEIN